MQLPNAIGERTGKEPTELSAEKILSKETKEKLGEITFVTATRWQVMVVG